MARRGRDPRAWSPRQVPQTAFEKFMESYVEAALWASVDEDDRPLDDNHGVDDIHPETLGKMAVDAEDFLRANWADISDDLGRAGHDFWLTRNGHGAGFWDGDWPEAAGRRLTESSDAYGEFTLYVGDDGMIHGR